MMATGHALSGACAGLVFSAATGISDTSALATAAAVALGGTAAIAGGLAGSALLPDADHHGSTVTTAFGPVSWYVHRGVVHVHNLVCRLTWDPGESMPGAHRGITHWWPWPLVTGTAVGVPCYFSQWAAVGVLSVLFTLAMLGITVPEYRAQERRAATVGRAHAVAGLVPTVWLLKRARRRTSRIGKSGVLLLGTASAWLSLHYAPQVGQWMGAIVTAGMFLHIVGDAPTRSRVPGWTLRGEFPWPRRLAFTAGGTFEVLCCWVPLSLLCFAALPWVWPVALATLTGVAP